MHVVSDEIEDELPIMLDVVPSEIGSKIMIDPFGGFGTCKRKKMRYNIFEKLVPRGMPRL